MDLPLLPLILLAWLHKTKKQGKPKAVQAAAAIFLSQNQSHWDYFSESPF